MNVYEGELPFLINDEKRALTNAIVLTICAEATGYFAFGMKVAEKIVGNTTEAFGPRGVAGNAVD